MRTPISKTSLYIFTVLIVVGFAFYWYSYRPSDVRKKCYEETKGWLRNTMQEREQMYQACLHSYGF